MKMKCAIMILASGFFLIFIAGCQQRYTSEMSFTAESEQDIMSPYKVMRRVERIAKNAGMKPYTAPRAEDDLMEMVDIDDLQEQTGLSKSSVTYKHPQVEVYLTVTRYPDEVVVLLNLAGEKPGKTEIQYYKLLHKELTEKLPKQMAIKVVEVK